MKYICHSAEETQKLAAEIAGKLNGGETLLLNGYLGAGKTTFTKGLAFALGVKKTVNSPTFTIIKEYKGDKLYLYHIDMYRLDDDTELNELGVEDCFMKDSIVVIEWNRLKRVDGKVITLNFEVLSGDVREIEVIGL